MRRDVLGANIIEHVTNSNTVIKVAANTSPALVGQSEVISKTGAKAHAYILARAPAIGIAVSTAVSTRGALAASYIIRHRTGISAIPGLRDSDLVEYSSAIRPNTPNSLGEGPFPGLLVVYTGSKLWFL